MHHGVCLSNRLFTPSAKLNRSSKLGPAQRRNSGGLLPPIATCTLSAVVFMLPQSRPSGDGQKLPERLVATKRPSRPFPVRGVNGRSWPLADRLLIGIKLGKADDRADRCAGRACSETLGLRLTPNSVTINCRQRLAPREIIIRDVPSERVRTAPVSPASGPYKLPTIVPCAPC